LAEHEHHCGRILGYTGRSHSSGKCSRRHLDPVCEYFRPSNAHRLRARSTLDLMRSTSQRMSRKLFSLRYRAPLEIWLTLHVGSVAFSLAVDSADHSQNLPCNTNVSMTITIAKYQYNVATSELVQPRDRAGQTCWGSVVAWQNGSTAEGLGEVRMGTPFMSGVYSYVSRKTNMP